MAKPKSQHFLFLDGMRGIAALCVALLHASQHFAIGYKPEHAGLAVDLFFILSGFVVAHAYNTRLAAEMTFVDFSMKRLIRLYPMIILGVLLGSAAYLIEAWARVGTGQGWGLLTVTSFVLIPYGLRLSLQAFPINNPLWSLFFELFANVVYAIERRVDIGRVLRAVAIALFGAALLFVTLRYKTVTKMGFNPPISFWLGFPRVLFPFFLGCFLTKIFHRFEGVKTPELLLTLILLGLLLFPGAYVSPLYDIACIFGVFPVLILLGTHQPTGTFLAKSWTFLGALSYPFYLIHQPVIRIISAVASVSILGRAGAPALVVLSLTAATLVSYGALKLFDEPVRTFLSGRFGKAKLATAGATVQRD